MMVATRDCKKQGTDSPLEPLVEEHFCHSLDFSSVTLICTNVTHVSESNYSKYVEVGLSVEKGDVWPVSGLVVIRPI